MMRVSLYAGLFVAAGLCVPVMAGAFDFGRFGEETDGGIQVDTGKTKSWLYTGNKSSTDGLTGIGVVTDPVTTGGVNTKTKVLGYDLTSGNPDGYTAHRDIRSTIDKGSVDKLFNNTNVDYEIVQTDPFPGKDGITQDYNSFSDWKGKTVTSDRFVKDATDTEATMLEEVVVDSDKIARNPYDVDKADTTYSGQQDAKNASLEKQDMLKNKREDEKRAYEAETDRLANKCKDAKNQSDASKMAGSDAAIKADLEKSGMNPTQECMASAKKAFEACAKGDVAGVKQAWSEGDAACKESPIDVATPAPVSKKTADTNFEPVLEGPVSLLDQAKNAVKKFLNLDANGQASPMQQMLLGMAMQKVQEMLSGGGGDGGGSDDSTDDGYDDEDDVKLTCNKVTDTTRKTLISYLDPETGEKVDEAETEDEKADSAAAAKANGRVMPNFGDDAKKSKDAEDDKADLIKVKTVITTQECKNGNMRVKAVETKTYPDGKVESNTYEDIVGE